MKNLQKLRWKLLVTSAALLVTAAFCEWKRRILGTQSNDVLRKGDEQYIADSQTNIQYFAHSAVLNNRLMLAEFALISLFLIILVFATWLFIRYRSNKA